LKDELLVEPFLIHPKDTNIDGSNEPLPKAWNNAGSPYWVGQSADKNVTRNYFRASEQVKRLLGNILMSAIGKTPNGNVSGLNQADSHCLDMWSFNPVTIREG
jgi:hypothetical protein